MSLQLSIWLIVGLTFALYIGIAIWSRASSTNEFYVARFQNFKRTRRVLYKRVIIGTFFGLAIKILI